MTTTTAACRTTAGLFASDIDFTLLVTGCKPTPRVVEAIGDLQAAGHHLALATGRSLVGALAAVVDLEIREAHVVASNGAVTARVADGKCTVLAKREAPAEKALRHVARAIVGGRLKAAAEVVGYGYRVTSRFPDHELPGTQIPSNLEGLWAAPTPRIALRGEGASGFVPGLRALGVTAHATRPDWIDVTSDGLSKATALEHLRAELGVHPGRTVSMGDAPNDLEMLRWAATPVVMSNATDEVKVAVADLKGETTGSVWQDGAAYALDSATAWLSNSARCEWWTDCAGQQRCTRPAVDKIGAYWQCGPHIDEELRRNEGTVQRASE
ncbi:HAD family hydrolase [Myceligenerans halotolerans]